MKKLGKRLIDYFIFILKIVLIMMILLFPLIQSHAFQDFLVQEVIVTSESELRAAIERGDKSIVVNDTIHLESVIVIETNVTINGSGTITVADRDRHFVVVEEGELTLQGDVVLTRMEGYTGNGGGILVFGGILIMRGGHITGNDWWIAPEDGGLDLFSISTWESFIYDGAFGGGVLVYNGGVFRLYDGVISQNTAIYGGGVFTSGGLHAESLGSRLTMYGGYIQDNHAELGGGVYTSGEYYIGGATVGVINGFQMYGGEISNNTARLIGGGVYQDFSIMRLNGGQINDNQAANHGGVYGVPRNFRTQMRIINNYPANYNESSHLLFWQIITPTTNRVLVVFALAVVGFVYETRRKKRVSEVKDK